MSYLFLLSALANAIFALMTTVEWTCGERPGNIDRFVAVVGSLMMAIYCLEHAAQ